jgi:hypothetical protein
MLQLERDQLAFTTLYLATERSVAAEHPSDVKTPDSRNTRIRLRFFFFVILSREVRLSQ